MDRLPSTLAAVLGLALALAACAPSLNWREVRPAGSGALAMFPCKPKTDTRRVALAGPPVELAVFVCKTSDVTYALSHADVADPARVSAALQALRASAVANIGGRVASERSIQVEGMTPHPDARLLELAGKLPGGEAVQERVALFSKGTRVFQATMFGASLDAEASETFFSGLRLP